MAAAASDSETSRLVTPASTSFTTALPPKGSTSERRQDHDRPGRPLGSSFQLRHGQHPDRQTGLAATAASEINDGDACTLMREHHGCAGGCASAAVWRCGRRRSRPARELPNAPGTKVIETAADLASEVPAPVVYAQANKRRHRIAAQDRHGVIEGGAGSVEGMLRRFDSPPSASSPPIHGFMRNGQARLAQPPGNAPRARMSHAPPDLLGQRLRGKAAMCPSFL